MGTHISFVRSIAMDSWTENQLAVMKNGGNKKVNDYLKSKGINARASIKAKYDSGYAQLYKDTLKARVEGRPEPSSPPTSLPATFLTTKSQKETPQFTIPALRSLSGNTFGYTFNKSITSNKISSSNNAFGSSSNTTCGGTPMTTHPRKISLDDDDFFANFGA